MVKLASPTDRLADLLGKMNDWRAAGVHLTWLIIPATETGRTFEPPHAARLVQGFAQALNGEPLWPGFALKLRELRVST